MTSFVLYKVNLLPPPQGWALFPAQGAEHSLASVSTPPVASSEPQKHSVKYSVPAYA